MILLVEDDDAVRSAVHRMLRLEGHDVMAARDGADALEQSDGHEGDVDVLVTDVVMPGMSGPELARVLRTRRPRIGVIYCSGHAGEDLDQRHVEPTDAVFLQKPVPHEVLSCAISQVTAD